MNLDLKTEFRYLSIKSEIRCYGSRPVTVSQACTLFASNIMKNMENVSMNLFSLHISVLLDHK